MELPLPLEILRQACERFGYRFTVVDEFSGYLATVSDGERHFLAGTGKLTPFPLNRATVHRVCGDKAFTRDILQKEGFAMPRGGAFFIREDVNGLRPSGRGTDEALRFAEELGYPVFVKPHARAHGLGCAIISDEKALRAHLQTLAQSSLMAIVEEVVLKPEYRIFVVNGEVQFVYRRCHPEIVGDGQRSIEALVRDFNEYNVLDKRTQIDMDSDFLRFIFEQKKYSKESILSPGEKLQISSQSNLAGGGMIADYREDVSPEVQAWIDRLDKAFPGLAVFGVDVFADEVDDPETFMIIEMNSNPSFNGIWNLGKREKVFSIWQKMLEASFRSE